MTQPHRRAFLAASLALAITLTGCNGGDTSVTTMGASQDQAERTPVASPTATDQISATTGAASPTPREEAVAARLREEAVAARLRQRITEAVEGAEARGGRVAVVVLDPQRPEDETLVAVNEADTYLTASLYKLFVAGAALSAVDGGDLRLDSPVAWSSCPTVEQALALMIIHSHNECAQALAHTVGWGAVAEHVEEAGLLATDLHLYPNVHGSQSAGDPESTATDVARWLRLLHRGELLSRSSTRLLVDLMEQQFVTHTLAQSLDPELVFAHKTGTLDHHAHDAGLLRSGDRTWVTVLLSDGWIGYGVQEARPTLDTVGGALSEGILRLDVD